MMLLLVAALLANDGHATETHQGSSEQGHAPMDAPTFILHHVMDSDEYEFEIPLPDSLFPVANHPKIHLGEIFASLKWSTVPGACEMHPEGALGALAPSLARFLEGCRDFRPTKATLMMWIATALLFLVVLTGVRREKGQLVPRGLVANVVEVLLLFVRDEIAYKNIGKKDGDRYVPFLTTIFFFVLFMNWLGLIPNFGSATGQLSVTLVLATITFILVQAASIKSAGLGGYLSHLTAGTPVAMWPIMVPVEFLGLFTKPIALMIRLFANMLGGHLVLFFILGLIFMLHPLAFAVSVPMASAIYLLEIFVGILQAYIFTLLSALFIGQGVEMGHHGHGDEHGEEHAH